MEPNRRSDGVKPGVNNSVNPCVSKREAYVSVRDAAYQLGWTAEWVRRLCRENKLRGVLKLGRQWRIPRSTIEELLRQEQPPVSASVREQILAELLRHQLRIRTGKNRQPGVS